MSSSIKVAAFLRPTLPRSSLTLPQFARRCTAPTLVGSDAASYRRILSHRRVPRPGPWQVAAAPAERAVFTMAAGSPKVTLALDAFCMRQFDDPAYAGTRLEWDKDDFEARINAEYEALLSSAGGDPGAVLKDGYAPFCKHFFVRNFIPSATLTTLAITPENEALLRTKYAARTESELPVLIRFFPLAAVGAGAAANWLDIILYSREQIIKERTSRPGDEPDGGKGGEAAVAASMGDAPWRIISVKAQEVDTELPMQPITVMRNALIGEGGSGVGIDRGAYEASVAYWRDRAVIM